MEIWQNSSFQIPPTKSPVIDIYNYMCWFFFCSGWLTTHVCPKKRDLAISKGTWWEASLEIGNFRTSSSRLRFKRHSSNKSGANHDEMMLTLNWFCCWHDDDLGFFQYPSSRLALNKFLFDQITIYTPRRSFPYAQESQGDGWAVCTGGTWPSSVGGGDGWACLLGHGGLR